MTELIFRLLLLGVGYLIGSVPVGYMIARWRGIDDIRLHGSGATGATNVSRVLGKRYFFIIFAFDFLKAYASLALAFYLCNVTSEYLSIFAIGLVAGNGWPVFLGFRGGKGVATSLGILALLVPLTMALLLLIWFIVWRRVKNIGIASVVLFTCMICASFYIPVYQVLLCVIGILGVILHKKNISDYIVYRGGRKK